MINEVKNGVATYVCNKMINDLEELREIHERNADSNIITGKDSVYLLYKLLGIDIPYEDIFKIDEDVLKD